MVRTQVEDAALSRILLALGLPHEHIDEALEKMRVDRREWSDDVTDAALCAGQFIYFSPMPSFPISESHTHMGVWASHEGMPGGADFILFLTSGVPTVLEIGFFGFSVPKTILDGPPSDFGFRSVECTYVTD
jgi:hypothetical protein